MEEGEHDGEVHLTIETIPTSSRTDGHFGQTTLDITYCISIVYGGQIQVDIWALKSILYILFLHIFHTTS